MAKKLAAILLCVVLIFVGVLALGHLTRPLGDDVAIANVENFHKLPDHLAVCPRLAGDPDAQGGADRGHAHQQQRV